MFFKVEASTNSFSSALESGDTEKANCSISKITIEKRNQHKLNFRERIILHFLKKKLVKLEKGNELEKNVSIKTKLFIIIGLSLLIGIFILPTIGLLTLILGFIIAIPKVKHQERVIKKDIPPIDTNTPEYKAKRNNRLAIGILVILVLIILLAVLLSSVSFWDILRWLYH